MTISPTFVPTTTTTAALVVASGSDKPEGSIVKRCLFFSAVLGQIIFILAGNCYIHKSLDEFEIWPDPTTDHRISCP